MSKTLTVTMLDVLREPFEEWLASRGLVMARPPDFEDPDAYIVVPGPMFDAVLDNREGRPR